TESADPLSSPSTYLLNDLFLQTMLHALKDFIVNRKPHIVTDHTFSSPNAGIPASKTKVKYDDIHPFSKALYNAKIQHSNADFTLYKSDITKAFLNLPTHSLWQIHQVVLIDDQYYICYLQLLIFWKYISYLFDDPKQIYGQSLKIINFWVDANQRSVSLTQQSVIDAKSEVNSFLLTLRRASIL
ncbi:uncharacterized protein BT62DRAFT_906267, partial [Guyanagaster necrorhizus]